MLRTLTLTLGLCLWASLADAAIYRCVGPGGQQIFTDRPCEDDRDAAPFVSPDCRRLTAPREQLIDCFDLWRWMVLPDPNASVLGDGWIIDSNGRRTVVVEADSGTPGSPAVTVYMQCPLQGGEIDRAKGIALAHRSLATMKHGSPLEPPRCGGERLDDR